MPVKNISSFGILINIVLFSYLLLTASIPTIPNSVAEIEPHHLSPLINKELSLNNVTISSPLDNRKVKSTNNNYDPTQLEINIPLTAEYPEPTTDTITFVACNESSICFNNELWIGDVFSDTTSIPGQSSINISPFITGSNSTQNVSIYGLINAEINPSEPITSFSYEDTTSLDKPIKITLAELPSDIDNDLNGIPDNLQTSILSGEFWVANQFINNAIRTVNIMNLNIPGDSVLIIPTNSVEIEVPTLEKLKSENNIDPGTNYAYAIITVSNEISALIDTVTDNSKTNSVSSWVETAINNAPGNLNPQNVFLGITLIAIDENQQIQLIRLNPQQTGVKIKLKNIQKPVVGKSEVFSYPVSITETYLTNDPDRELIWTNVNSVSSDNEITFQIQESSIIALFDVGITINEISPNIIPKGISIDLILKGIIPVSTALNVEQATELYEVKIGGQSALFREGSPDYKGIAITAYKNSKNNQMFIKSPSINETGIVDLEIIQKNVNNLSFVFPNAITVANTYKVTATIERGPNALSENAELKITPSKSPTLPEDGTFFEGETISISLNNVDEQDQFEGWYSSDGTLLSRLPEFITRVNSNLNIKARIVKRQYSLTITIDPPETGIVTLNPEGGIYAPETEVEVKAQPEQGFKFKHWLLPNGNTSEENPLTITINQDYQIKAVFEVGPPIFFGIAKLDGDHFEKDSDGKERLVVWAIGGVVRRIEGLNLDLETTLQLVDAKTGKDIGSPFNGIHSADDKKYLDFIVPPYPLYSDSMPEYVDVDLKTNDSIIPAFRYYHYSTDEFGIHTTAFISDFSKSEKTTVFLDNGKQGTFELPALSTQPTPVYGIFRAIKLSNNPTLSAMANIIGNTSIHGGMFGNPIENAYEITYYLYQPETFTSPPEPGTATYSPPKDGSGRLLFHNPVFPYNLDGTEKQDIPVIKITLPSDGLDYSYFKSGITVFSQSSTYDYIKNRVTPGTKTAYQSQILSTDIDPIMTENSFGNTNKVTMRVYSLNGFGLRYQSLLPFEVSALARLSTKNGVTTSKTVGKSEIQVVSPKGGLAYIDHIELRNNEKQISVTTKPESDPGETEGLLKFKTPAIKKSAIVDVLIYLKSQPNVPAIVLDNVIEYQKTPIILDSWILIPLGLIISVYGIIGIGDDESPCFIATAAYGTPMAEEINVLRAFRDQYMLTNAFGSAFVDVYYNISPPIAHWIATHPFFAWLTRCILTPIIILSKIAIVYPKTLLSIIIFITLYLLLRSIAKNKKVKYE